MERGGNKIVPRTPLRERQAKFWGEFGAKLGIGGERPLSMVKVAASTVHRSSFFPQFESVTMSNPQPPRFLALITRMPDQTFCTLSICALNDQTLDLLDLQEVIETLRDNDSSVSDSHETDSLAKEAAATPREILTNITKPNKINIDKIKYDCYIEEMDAEPTDRDWNQDKAYIWGPGPAYDPVQNEYLAEVHSLVTKWLAARIDNDEVVKECESFCQRHQIFELAPPEQPDTPQKIILLAKLRAAHALRNALSSSVREFGRIRFIGGDDGREVRQAILKHQIKEALSLVKDHPLEDQYFGKVFSEVDFFRR